MFLQNDLMIAMEKNDSEFDFFSPINSIILIFEISNLSMLQEWNLIVLVSAISL